MSYLVKLDDVFKLSMDEIGGKSYNLSLLFDSFLIPDGFCILSNAFKLFIEQSEFKEDINSIINHILETTFEDIESQSILFGDLIQKSNFPKEILDEIEVLANNKTLYAVRSSSTIEDGVVNSFAGQHDSFLNILKSDLVDYIKYCWASLCSPRAIMYMQAKKLKKLPSMSVLIQRMVEPIYSGIMFTKDPKEQKHVMIELAPGLAEDIVFGKISPNNYLFDKTNSRLISSNIKRDISINIEAISRVGLEIEKFFGKPMDIEFSIDKSNSIWILQARPITSFSS